MDREGILDGYVFLDAFGSSGRGPGILFDCIFRGIDIGVDARDVVHCILGGDFQRDKEFNASSVAVRAGSRRSRCGVEGSKRERE